MINTRMVSVLCLALTVSASPMPAAADTLRPLTTESRPTLVGLEESLLGQKLRNTGRRLASYAALAGLMFQVAQDPNLLVPQAAGATPAATPSPATLPPATVTTNQLTLTFAPELVNERVAAYLFIPGDIGYLQGALQQIPVTGVVTFPTPFSPPNRPGWLGTGVDRVVAVYPNNSSAPATSTQLKIPGAPLVLRIAPDGTLSVLAGTWPAPLLPTESRLAHLRQYLGPDKAIGTIAWDPVELLTNPALADFFSLAVRAEVDTVWVGGFRFRTAMTAAQRQALVDKASRAGVKTLGFVDGNFDWAEQRTFVANHYDELFRAIAAIRFDGPRASMTSHDDALIGTPTALYFGGMRIALMTDVERWTAPGWDGDLGPYMALIQEIILPRVRAFRDSHPTLFEPSRPLVFRFEATLLRNGAATTSGAVVHGLVPVPETAVIGGTYGDTAERIAALAGPFLDRARIERMRVQISVDTTAGLPGYSGNLAQLPRDLLAAVRSLPPQLVDGVFIHAPTPTTAYGVLTALAPPLAAPLAVSPDGRWSVRRVAAGGVDRLEFWNGKTLGDRYALPADLAGGTLYPQFPGNDYLLLLARAPGRGVTSSAFYVFGARPGASGTTWPLATLVDEQGGRWPFVSRDGPSPSSAPPITIHYALPERSNQVRIEYAPLTNPTAPRTVVFTIVAPTGLEEEADQFLGERRLERQAVGELA